MIVLYGNIHIIISMLSYNIILIYDEHVILVI